MNEDVQSLLRKERNRDLDQFSKFLLPTKPTKVDQSYYDKRKQMIGKELSTGNLEWEHISSFVKMFDCAEEFLLYEQEITARFIMNKMISELKLSMSKEGMFIDKLLTAKLEYDQTQHIHQYPEEQPKRFGLFRR